MAEPDSVHRLALVPQLELQVLVGHQPLRNDFDHLAEDRRREALAPHLVVQGVDQIGPAVFGRQRTVGVQAPQQRRRIQPLLRNLPQSLLEDFQVFLGEGAAGGHGVPAKTQQHAGMALGDQVQRVAQMKAGNRAARALELVLLAGRLAGREHEGRPVQPVLDARCDDPDHAFVEVGVEHADRRGRLLAVVDQRVDDLHRLVAHAAFDVAAVAVDGVERAGQLVGAGRVVRQQALDSQRHVGQPAGGIDARSQREAEIEGGRDFGIARRHGKQAGHAAGQGAGANPLEPLRHQAPVVGVELDHIGHRAQRHQRQQGVQLGLVVLLEHAALSQFRAQRQQHVEHHADTGERLAFEAAAGLIGVDDDGRVGQLRAGQVVIGHQHLQAQRIGRGHAFDAGDAVVHGDQQVGAVLLDALRDRRSEAVPVDHAVGHEVVEFARAQQLQAAQGDRAGGGAVAVIVGHHAQLVAGRDAVGQQHGRFLQAFHAGGRQQAGQPIVELLHGQHAARRVQAGQQGMDAALLQRPGRARRDVAGEDLHSDSSRLCARLPANRLRRRRSQPRPSGLVQVCAA